MGMTIEDNVAIFNFFTSSGAGGADAFLFFASLSAAFVSFTSDADGRVINFKGEAVVGATVEELDGGIEPNLAASLLLWYSTTLVEAMMNCSFMPWK